LTHGLGSTIAGQMVADADESGIDHRHAATAFREPAARR